MRRLITIVVVLSCVECVCRTACAVFTGLEVVVHTTVQTPTGPLAVYRLYARFSEPSDQLLAWGAMSNHHTAIGTKCGGSFFNPSDGSFRAPSQAMIVANPMVEWDTFATIGVAIADDGPGGVDATMFLSKWPDFINGNQVTMDDQVVVVLPDSPQSRADYAQDGQLRVLMAQLTTSVDEGIINGTVEGQPGQIGFVAVKSQDWGAAMFYDFDLQIMSAVGRCCTQDGCVFAESAECAVLLGGNMIDCQPCTVCNSKCYADLAPPAGDGSVGVMDLLRVIELWGPCLHCAGDVAPPGGDDVVGVPDLLAIINNWGPCR